MVLEILGFIIIVRILNLPSNLEAITLYNCFDDTYNIYLNSLLIGSDKSDAMEHELFHIRNGDFLKSDVSEIEFYAHVSV